MCTLSSYVVLMELTENNVKHTAHMTWPTIVIMGYPADWVHVLLVPKQKKNSKEIQPCDPPFVLV